MLNPQQLVLTVDLLALQMGQGKNPQELAVLGRMITQLGDTLSTMAAQSAYVQQANTTAAPRPQPRPSRPFL